MDKVYCNECKYLEIDKITLTVEYKDYVCNSKSNISHRDNSNWLNRNEMERTYIDKPEDINKHNLCVWYERKE
ncbi:hypothetical protein LCGC14_2285500 [marine sediment metagenome]|uniref:Uncharacterized protein n=1 Tax=marine sediment metagenome TaxID=412755 RepID=A0A0F9DF86_9ZZZZ